MSCGEQFRALEEGKLDPRLCRSTQANCAARLEFRTIASYKTVAALPKNNPLAGKPTIELKALAPMFFIGMSEASYPYYHEWLSKTCHRAGFTPKVCRMSDKSDDDAVRDWESEGRAPSNLKEELKPPSADADTKVSTSG